MSPRSKREYLEAVYWRYIRAKPKEKTAILDEFCSNCRYHRKHAIRLLRNYRKSQNRPRKNRGKPSIYNNDLFLKVLTTIWLAANLPCSKRLKAILVLWLPGYCRTYGQVSPQVLALLEKVSPPTIDRLLKPLRGKYKTRGRSTTKPGTLLKKQIPVKTNQWDESRPGFLEADTVAHCGDSLLGTFVYTIDAVDIATGWTEQRAVWGKGEQAVMEQIKDIESALPFPLLGFDCDNGSEFLNHHLLRHFQNRKSPVQFTRSRPYHKDDNAHVEQKNWTHVREWLGYHRFDRQEFVPLLNNLYAAEWRLFHNFFCPSVKLLSKKRVASKTIKVYDSPKTPFQRLMESPHIPKPAKQALVLQCRSLNPFQLRQAMENEMKNIFALYRKTSI